MAKISSRCPTQNDIDTLALCMRQCDIDELYAVTDLSCLEAIQVSVDNSHKDFCWSYFADDKLLCIAGCTKVGNPWLLATPDIELHGLQLTRHCLTKVRMMLNKWGKLSNIIDVRNTKTCKWLKVLGFDFKETLELRKGFPVIKFEQEGYGRDREGVIRGSEL